MSDFDRWETRLQETARSFSYPPTPDIAGSVGRRIVRRRAGPAPRYRARLALAAVALVMAVALLVPPVRAGILEVLRIGAVRINLVEPTVTPPPTAEPSRTQPTVTPRPTPFSSILDLEGETTLAAAQARVDFPIRLPSYPADLGAPDKVFVQDFGGPVLIFVWLDDQQPDRVRLSMYQFAPGPYAEKSRPEMIKPVTVNGRPAIWGEGEHLLITRSGRDVMRRLVDGNVLVWTEGEVTYRIETDLPEAEAIHVAESLR